MWRKAKIEDNEKLVVTGNLSCQYYTTELGPPDNHSQPSASQSPMRTAVCKVHVFAFFYFCLVTPNMFLCPTEVRWFKVDGIFMSQEVRWFKVDGIFICVYFLMVASSCA